VEDCGAVSTTLRRHSALVIAKSLIRMTAIEIEPRYVQIDSIQWEAFTGRTAVKVGEALRA